MLTQFWPQANPAGHQMTPAESQVYLPYALQHSSFLENVLALELGPCEHSEPVRAHQPFQSLKHWGARARNLLRRTRGNSELTRLQKHRTTFLFGIIKASSQIFYNCRKDSQYKTKGKEKPPKETFDALSFIYFASTY